MSSHSFETRVLSPRLATRARRAACAAARRAWYQSIHWSGSTPVQVTSTTRCFFIHQHWEQRMHAMRSNTTNNLVQPRVALVSEDPAGHRRWTIFGVRGRPDLGNACPRANNYTDLPSDGCPAYYRIADPPLAVNFPPPVAAMPKKTSMWTFAQGGAHVGENNTSLKCYRTTAGSTQIE